MELYGAVLNKVHDVSPNIYHQVIFSQASEFNAAHTDRQTDKPNLSLWVCIQ